MAFQPASMYWDHKGIYIHDVGQLRSGPVTETTTKSNAILG